MKNIAVLGYGVVGSGVAEVLLSRGEALSKRVGEPINIKYILDIRDFPDSPFSDRIIKDFSIIERDDTVSVVAECIGGLEPAFDYVTRCLRAGKSVVTSNKELIATKGAQLLRLAHSLGLNLFFEASVGGGIPIIKPLHQCLGANEIKSIAGILNGTTNYIITKMVNEGQPFADALKKAQELGYAESDPTADVEGHDACRKICILASIAFGKHVYPDQVYTCGITKLSPADFSFAGSIGRTIKLIAFAMKNDSGKITAMVTPALIPLSSQLASISDVFNGIVVDGDATGEVLFYGKGAGKFPTASAMVSDIIDALCADGSVTSLFWEDSEEGFAESSLDAVMPAYMRLSGDGAISLLKERFGSALVCSSDGAGGWCAVTPPVPGRELVSLREMITNAGGSILCEAKVLDF